MSPFAERRALVLAAMESHGEYVEVSDIEARLQATLGGPSYTLRTLSAIASERPDADVRLVIGSDILTEVERWHRWEEIARDYAPIVVPRAGYAAPEECPLPAVSSTQVRRWLDEPGPESDKGLAAHLPAAVWRRLRPSSSATVWLVGGGHVGEHAASWLGDRGQAVVTVGARALCSDPSSRPEGTPSAVWILANDPNITRVAEALIAAELPSSVPVLHAAGSRRAAEVLAPLCARGQPVGTLHPICSLRRERPQAMELRRAAFGVEGDPEAREVALGWVGAQPWLDLQGQGDEVRRAYHAACSLAANHLAVPLHAARSVLCGQGHATTVVDEALATLLRSSLENLLALGLPAGITGPVSRGDDDAVKAHLAALQGPAADLYRTLSERLAAIVRETKDAAM